MWNSKNKVTLSPRLKLGVGRGYAKSKLFKITSASFLVVGLALGAHTVSLLVSNDSANSASLSPRVAGASITQNTPEEVKPFKTYTVQKGDTLFNISQKINVPWTTLAELNKMKPPFSLKPGQSIMIPNNE